VSGCGNDDLRCTVVFVKKAAAEWQWGEFHVSMPRTFFVDSPGSNCAGQHLCAGVTTNAWSFVGVPPRGQSPPPPPPPPGSARLCLGRCGKASVVTPKELAAGETSLAVTAECGGAGGSSARAAQFETFCPIEAKLEVDKGAASIEKQLQEDRARERAKRFEIMKDLQQKIFDITQEATTQKVKAADKALKSFDGYLRSNAGSPDVVALLQDADAGEAASFPPPAGTARARRAQATGPDASALFDSLTATKPKPGDAQAYADALAVARSPVESFERSRARLLLSLSVIAGRRVVLDAIGDRKAITVASGDARVPRGGDRKLKLEPTPAGRLALRLVGITGLSKKVTAGLTVRSDGAKASRDIRLGG
jgi:hypothetical protein